MSVTVRTCVGGPKLEIPPTPKIRVFRVSGRPSAKKGGIYHGNPSFPKNSLKKAGILSRGHGYGLKFIHHKTAGLESWLSFTRVSFWVPIVDPHPYEPK